MKKYNSYKNQKGNLLIDLMVGLLMSSVTVLGVTTIYSYFEIQKRTTVQLGQTVSNAAIAMFPMQHNAKMAGYGIAINSIMGCDVKAYNKMTNQDFDFELLPVKIIPGVGSTSSDTVKFMYGNSTTTIGPINLIDNTNANNANIKVEDKIGFSSGDLVILFEAGKDCNLAQVSGVHGTSDVVIRNTGNYTDPVTGQKVDIKYNKSGGLNGGVSYSANAQVLNIGSDPQSFSYSIVNNQLVEYQDLTGQTTVVADNIVLLRARYGLDEDEDGKVERWTSDIGGSGNYKYLRAVKLALIARTPLIEQKSNGACNATTNSVFRWGNEEIDIEDISENWGCYRYRFIQSVVPLRNMTWANT